MSKRASRSASVSFRLRAEHALAAVEHPHLAVQRRIPVALRHARGQHAVEQCRARRRQQQRTLRLADAPAGKHRQRRLDIAAIVAEALFAETVGYAARAHRLQPRLDVRRLAAHLAQGQHETIARQRPARQLASVPARFEHVQPLDLQRDKIRRLLLRQVHAEALAGERMAILQAGITDAHLRNAGPARQLLGDRSRPALLDRQQQVFALSVRRESRQFLDEKILRPGAQVRPQHGPAEGRGNTPASNWLMRAPAARRPARRCLRRDR
jgi:hypothetical protein